MTSSPHLLFPLPHREFSVALTVTERRAAGITPGGDAQSKMRLERKNPPWFVLVIALVVAEGTLYEEGGAQVFTRYSVSGGV
jgi:hypothetical protein